MVGADRRRSDSGRRRVSGRLEGKVVIITGSANGIGAATARLMAAEGASLVLADIDGEKVHSVAEPIGALGLAVDVTDEAAVAEMVELTVHRYGHLDVLHNNAVAVRDDDTDTVGTTNAAWTFMFEVIVMAAVYGCRHAIPAMIASGGGSIINTSSGAARQATGSRIAYGSLKAALEGLSMYTASMFGASGIRSNVIQPAFVRTPAAVALLPADQIAGYGSASAAGRVAEPEDVARVALFLASDDSTFVSGQVIPVNGGGTRGQKW
jgi:NAD(P)-dependent dehydrogenase (short-subunit alcohol dehydrogenase family)